LSVISFNDRAEVIVPATRGLDINKIDSRISMLHTRGGTEIYMGLQAGMNEIGRNLNPSYLSHIILITDGRTYGDEDDCLKLAGVAALKGVTIHGLGIGHKWNDEFLDALTGKTGGSSAFATQTKGIKDFLKTKFGQIEQTFANNVTLDYTTNPDVELRYAFRLSPDAGGIEGNKTLSVGDIPLGRSLSILLEFVVHNVPEGATEFTMSEGTLNLNIPTRVIPHVSTKFTLARPAAPSPEPHPPPQVLVKAMSRLSLYRLQEQAQKELASGEVDKATRRLNHLATQLLTSGEQELAQTVMLELNNIEGGDDSLSEAAKKRIKYGTRALLLPPGEEPS
jgi:Ca-activated chloride channel family protein